MHSVKDYHYIYHDSGKVYDILYNRFVTVFKDGHKNDIFIDYHNNNKRKRICDAVWCAFHNRQVGQRNRYRHLNGDLSDNRLCNLEFIERKTFNNKYIKNLKINLKGCDEG